MSEAFGAALVQLEKFTNDLDELEDASVALYEEGCDLGLEGAKFAFDDLKKTCTQAANLRKEFGRFENKLSGIQDVIEEVLELGETSFEWVYEAEQGEAQSGKRGRVRQVELQRKKKEFRKDIGAVSSGSEDSVESVDDLTSSSSESEDSEEKEDVKLGTSASQDTVKTLPLDEEDTKEKVTVVDG